MGAFWKAILGFFGLTDDQPPKGKSVEDLMRDISSQEKTQRVTQEAFKTVMAREPIQAGRLLAYEGNIRADVMAVDTALTEFHHGRMTKTFGEAQYLLSSGYDNDLNSCSVNHVKGQIETSIAKHRANTEALQDKLRQETQDLNTFRGAHGLTQDAVYPESKNDALWWIAGIALLEAIFNAAFLRQGISGLNVALAVALGIAAINVGGNVWFGIKYRNKNHTDASISNGGKIFKPLSVCLIIFLNVAIFVFRYLAVSYSYRSYVLFWLESLILLLAGLFLGALAFDKGYGLDDPFPGYGKKTKSVKDLDRQLVEIRGVHAQICETYKETALNLLSALSDRIEKTHETILSQLPVMARDIETWRLAREQLNFYYGQLQGVFKATIRVNHPDGETYIQEIVSLFPNALLNSSIEQVKNYRERLSESNEKIANLRASIAEKREKLVAWLFSEEAQILLRWPT